MKAVAAALVLALPVASTPAATGAGEPGDPARGAAIYERCIGCHALSYNRTGPLHCGLLGRRAGSVPGFPYSPAMAAAGFVWTESTLDRFLSGPARMLPGTSMGYAGIADARERADLIAWLRQAGEASPECRQLTPRRDPPPDSGTARP